jgi:L-lactate dehydrogenase complex protein LldE
MVRPFERLTKIMRAQLFATCLIDTFYPETGEAVVKLLRHFGVDVTFPKEQTCCGKPADSGGYAYETQKAAEHFLSVFEGSDPIVVPSGSCASMVKTHYPKLFKRNDRMREKAEQTAARVFELSQFLVHTLEADKAGLKGSGKVTYHASCQLVRELNVREEPIRLLESLSGVTFVSMELADRCCGFGGVFMAKQPEISMALVDKKAEMIVNSGADTVTGCDHGCLMNITDALKRRGSSIQVKHIAQVLAEGI